MKKHYVYLLVVLAVFGCKKSDKSQVDTPVTAAPTMHIIINSDHIFSYNITEGNTTTGDFATKDDYNVPKLDYSFTPKPGNTVTIEAAAALTSNMTATVTYKDQVLGPIVTHGNGSNPGTGLEYSYVIPGN